MKQNDTVLSLIQPTGSIHIGNFFGAISNWVKLQANFNCVFGIANLHAMTIDFVPKILKNQTEEMVFELLACGLNLNKCILFIQSLVPEHTELHWILECNCSFGELKRQTHFKDKTKAQKDKEENFIKAGLFTYPVLQAADILIYRATHIPVGKDQEQHLELARNIAKRVNHLFGDVFVEPQVLLTETPKICSLIEPEKKMSKSLGSKHFVGVFPF